MWTSKVLAFFLAAVVLTRAQDEVTVDTSLGQVKGLKANTNFNGKPYFSFRGIPYAKPPVGPNKFDAPTPPEPWSGALDATAHRQTCVFFCMIRQGIFGDEDCLYLNVYTPSLEKDAKKPVMVFIHPGGFNGGSGDDDVYGPDFIVEQDVILVTFNFRLGAVGFLSTGDENVPGNNGLKDQSMVLKWIRDNIAHFGGNPEMVTLFGMSSGSAAIQFHMLSPMSKGLFRAAIMESGSALNPWAMSYNPKDMAFKLGEVLGVATKDTKELITKLKDFTVQELVTANGEVSKVLNHMNGRSMAFLPCVEPNVGQEVFLPNDPWTLIKTEDLPDIPIMIGMNLDETSFMAPMFLPNADFMDKNFDLFIPDDVNATDAQKKEWGEMLRKFYFDGKALTSDSKEQFTQMTSDIFFNIGNMMSSKLFSAKMKSPIYKYLFSYYSAFGIMKNLFKQDAGVAHGDEIGYLFYSNAFKNKPEAGSPQEKMTRTLTKLWTNFAKENNPTPSLDDDLKVTWEPMGTDDNYLEIAQEMKMEKNLIKERLKFWAQIYNDAIADYAFLFK